MQGHQPPVIDPGEGVPFGRTIATAAVGGGLAGGYAVWSFYTLTSPAFGAIGFLATLWGLIVSLVGFWYTIQQVKRTRTSTEAVKKALANLKLRVKIVDVTFEAQRAVKLLESTLIYLQHESWASASASLWEAQSVTYRLQENVTDASKAEEIRNLTSNFLAQIQILDDLAKKRVKLFDTGDIRLNIRSLINVLDNATVSAQKDLYDA